LAAGCEGTPADAATEDQKLHHIDEIATAVIDREETFSMDELAHEEII